MIHRVPCRLAWPQSYVCFPALHGTFAALKAPLEASRSLCSKEQAKLSMINKLPMHTWKRLWQKDAEGFIQISFDVNRRGCIIFHHVTFTTWWSWQGSLIDFASRFPRFFFEALWWWCYWILFWCGSVGPQERQPGAVSKCWFNLDLLLLSISFVAVLVPCFLDFFGVLQWSLGSNPFAKEW